MMDEIDEPRENTMSIEELRKEVRRCWDSERELVKGLRNLPPIPDWRVLKLMGRAGVFPADWERGKRIQSQYPFAENPIPPKTEYEIGMGLWSRIRNGLLKLDD